MHGGHKFIDHRNKNINVVTSFAFFYCNILSEGKYTNLSLY